MSSDARFTQAQKDFLREAIITIDVDLRRDDGSSYFPATMENLSTRMAQYIDHASERNLCFRLLRQAKLRNDPPHSVMYKAIQQYDNLYQLMTFDRAKLHVLCDHYAPREEGKGVDAFVKLLRNKQRIEMKSNEVMGEPITESKQRQIRLALKMLLPFESIDQMYDHLGDETAEAIDAAHEAVEKFVCDRRTFEKEQGMDERGLRKYVSMELKQARTQTDNEEVNRFLDKLQVLFDIAREPGELEVCLAQYSSAEAIENALRTGDFSSSNPQIYSGKDR